MEKVKDAIKNNLPDLVSEESIVMSNGREVIKIPIRSLDEYKIRYNYDNSKHVGQGQGDSSVGDVVARDGSKANQAPGKGKKRVTSLAKIIMKRKSVLRKFKMFYFMN